MVFIITGAGHTGKTLLAQRLLEKYKYPCLSIDHLKMGLIRSCQTELTPLSDIGALTEYLWPIVAEMIKTAIENKQNLIVEGCYVPINWDESFTPEYLCNIKFICLLMTEKYIKNHFDDIKCYGNIIETRLCDDITKQELIEEAEYYRNFSEKSENMTILIDEKYHIDIDDI